MTENKWLEKLRTGVQSHPRILEGPGDDAAVVAAGSGEFGLVSTDMLVDKVHFDCDRHLPEQIGRKALAVNLSDIAAMGGTPLYFTVSLALPPGTAGEYLDRIYAGMKPLMEEFNTGLAGGDTTSTAGPLVISITIFGESRTSGYALRSDAKEGDSILVSGTLGGSLISDKHLLFKPRVNEAASLLRNFKIHGMMDLSDGLVTDLRRLGRSSGLGAVLEKSSIPVCPSLASHPDALQKACTDGEDFELLLTAPRDSAKEMLTMQPLAPLLLSQVGYMTKGEGLWWQDCSGFKEVAWEGYEHRF